MKKFFIAIMSIVALIGCTEKYNELTESSQKDATVSINKLEYAYVEGNLKIETDSTASGEKIEFRAPNEYLATIQNLSNTSNRVRRNVTAVSNDVGDLVGVIAESNAPTGPYAVLEIFMDCEDSRSSNKKSGWIGANTVDRNVTLKICLVPKSLFKGYKFGKYAVLSLDMSSSDHIIQRDFDNEDGNNLNSIKLNGEKIDKATLLAKVGNSIRQDGNTSLKFYVYDQDVDNGLDSFPDLGIHYGVFGTSNEPYKTNGWILTDDEDSNNQNLSWYNGLLLEYPGNSELRNSVKDIVEPSANTIIHMYKVR